jgi:hypothetical protein
LAEPIPDLLINAISSGLYAHRTNGVRVDQDGLVHRVKGYNERRALWEFFCEDTYCGDAHVQRETFDNLTCVACFARMPWFSR